MLYYNGWVLGPYKINVHACIHVSIYGENGSELIAKTEISIVQVNEEREYRDCIKSRRDKIVGSHDASSAI